MDDVKKLCFFFFIVSVIKHSQPAQKEITLPVEERIKLLKFQIKEQLRTDRNHHHHHHHSNRHQKTPKQQNVDENILHLENEQYDYVDVDAMPITPVMDFDERKKEQKFKLRQLKTTTTEPSYAPATTTEYNYNKKPMRSALLKPLIEKPVDSFYRRYIEKDAENVPVEWVHCQDMIKPYVVGVKKELQAPVNVEERSYARFMQLLSENITSYSKDEVVSHLYQISNVNVRLFQWNVPKLMSLITLITKGKRHTFRAVTHGIREIFERWHLDYGNTTNLLRQSRIFRPPCVRSDHIGGSTKSSGASRYDKPTTPSTTCNKDRDDEDDK